VCPYGVRSHSRSPQALARGSEVYIRLVYPHDDEQGRLAAESAAGSLMQSGAQVQQKWMGPQTWAFLHSLVHAPSETLWLSVLYRALRRNIPPKKAN